MDNISKAIFSMFCDELKIGACRNGVLLALFGAISLGPVVCSAQAALPQKQEAVARTPEEHSAQNILTKAHPDWMVLRKTPEYNQWLNSKSADFRQTFESTWDANVVSKGLTEFKSWRDTTRQEAALLKKAKAGDADAQFRLGTRLPKSFDFDKDGNAIDNEGVKWLKRAAQQGHSGAKLRLAEMAAMGGVPTSGDAQTEARPKAMTWDELSATPPGNGRRLPPNIGAVEDGYRFKGGDPSQQANWEKYEIQHEAQKPTGRFVDFDKPSAENVNDGKIIPARSILGATGIVLLSVMLAFACAYLLWIVLGKSVKGSTPVATGRRWMNWVAMVACFQPLIKFFSQLLGGHGEPANVLMQGAIATTVFAGAAFGLGALWAYFRKRKSNSAGLPVASMTTMTTEQSARMADNQSFAVASEEVESGKIDKGLWARLYAETDGDEAKTKARYIKFRASQIDLSPAA